MGTDFHFRVQQELAQIKALEENFSRTQVNKPDIKTYQALVEQYWIKKEGEFTLKEQFEYLLLIQQFFKTIWKSEIGSELEKVRDQFAPSGFELGYVYEELGQLEDKEMISQ